MAGEAREVVRRKTRRARTREIRGRKSRASFQSSAVAGRAAVIGMHVVKYGGKKEARKCFFRD